MVTLLCDGGERYAGTYYSDDWLAELRDSLVQVEEVRRRGPDAATS